MTHPNHQTNGASLEDCHTNFFALTDLCGIKWRKLVWGESGFSSEPLEDPVLSSFSRCLAGDILCVWRRVGSGQQLSSAAAGGGLFDPIGLPQPTGPVHPPLSLQAAKELWIFWYGEEPDLSGLVAPELLSADGEQGSWESGLSYECRSLLFKALHNLIERCLLSRDFVRLGRWFVQPYDGSEKISEKSSHLSFSFAFFVHGESTVCASVDVRQHPPVRNLVRTHLQQAQACLHSGPGVQVILAPFGLAGTLTGQVFKALDNQTHRLMEDWRHFYPTREPSDLPPAVEVIVGGVKLRYPSCYVLVTDLDETTAALLSTPSASIKSSCLPSSGVTVSVVPQHQHHPDCMVHSATPSTVLPERVWQDATISCTPQADASPPTPLPESADQPREVVGQWDFQDPTRKQSCTCAKLPLSSYGQQSTPHHHQNDSLPVPSVGSPASVAPSPLPNPHSVPQPASIPPPDPTMPTLSPQPPPPHHHPPAQSPLEDKVVCTPDGHFHGPKSVSSVSNQVFSPYPSALSVEGTKAVDSVGGPGSAPPPPSVPAAAPVQPPHEPPPPTLKRPVLSSKEYESIFQDEDQPSNLLYDYSTLDAWLNHPVKRFKPTETRSEAPRANQHNLYSNTQAAPSPPHQLFIKQEPGVLMSMEVDNSVTGGGGLCKRSDPYEFEDDGIAAAVSMEGFKRNAGLPQVKEETEKKSFETVALNGPKCASGNLFTNEGLQATFKDLDQIFDNSDDASSDETALMFQLQVPTPPGSNKASDECGSGTLIVRPPRGSGGGVRPEELSKMFPTPPSHEHNPIASPCGGHLSDTPVHETPDFLPLSVVPRVRQETVIYPNMGSPQEEPIEDWSYVFRPPAMWKFVGSSKYAPLTNLPSQNLPPVVLPSHCVYKPSWMYNSHTHHQDKPTNHMNSMIPAVANSHPTRNNSHPLPPPPHAGLHPRGPMSPYPASPIAWRPPCPGPPAPPPPYSPAQQHNSVYKVGPGRPPEANSLVVNILLADTALNIFRDHNFDSCTLCVCNAGPKVVGNIRGADAGVYLPQAGTSISPYVPPGVFSPGHHPPDEDPIKCTCGFSAVVNRRLSHRSGLFLEDEMEITGLGDEREEINHSSLSGAALGVMDLVREQCVVVHSASNSLYRAAKQHRPSSAPATLNLLEFGDGNQVTLAALEQGRQAHLEQTTVAMCKVEEMAARQQQILHQQQHCGQLGGKIPAVHRWSYLRARGPRCSQDIVRIMKSLQPLLQDAIQKKCTTRLWEAPYTVSGPLTWRQFHRLAGRGTDDRCEPQPVPSVVVGHEKDWLSLAPYALQYWEKLLLEPFSYARDIAYIVVAPDNDYVLQRVRNFFKELSSTYEMCRLGRHCPITKVLRDGILRVGSKAALKLGKEPVDEWFTMLGDNSTTNMLKLYAQVCRHHLAPHLSQVTMDRTLLDPPEGAVPPRPAPTPSPMPPPSTPESQVTDKAPSTPKQIDQEECGRGESVTYSVGDCSHDDDNTEPPAIVLYLVEPFTLGNDSSDLQRLACLGLLRCFNTVLAALPDHIRANVTLQIISLESIVELGRSGDRNRRNDHMRALALSVFSQCRRQLQHQANTVKALTGFGTAACSDLFLKNKDEKNRAPYRVYTPPYVLARSRDKTGGECGDSLGSEQQCSVLFVSYCLSEDQRWLLATAIDEQGLVLETATINVHIPNRNRRRRASARRIGLQKLMDFILGVMSQSVTPWRLVVGRVGRIGHGELKGWSWLLSRKSLLKASKHLKEMCGQCALLYPHDVPCILSACLVSLEPDSALRLMPDQFTPDERFSQASVKCQLSTPQDVTCTHILVFPTSATTQSSQTAFQEQQINGPELGDEELFNALNDDMPDGMGDFNDIFNWPDGTEAGGVRSPGGSPRGRGGDSSQPGSPSCSMTGPDDHHSPFPCNGPSRSGDMPEEVGTLLQQPLALGYLVSTAPTGRMPRWFWAACPHLESVCPAFLKNALHLHSTAIQQNSDELLQQQSAVAGHPLDSQYTTDVLRYVLEGYNALSWLALDSNTHDRLSCLPVHMQLLMQLYHMTSALV